jgi:hypothetical protein
VKGGLKVSFLKPENKQPSSDGHVQVDPEAGSPKTFAAPIPMRPVVAKKNDGLTLILPPKAGGG